MSRRPIPCYRTEGFCQPNQPDFIPTCVPRSLCCPCCMIAETYTVWFILKYCLPFAGSSFPSLMLSFQQIMNGSEPDGMCGETGAIMCACLAAFYLTCGVGPFSVPLCGVVERRYIMKRYNIEGQGNPCCWLLGACWCCAHYQQRAFVIAYTANGATNDPLMPPVTTQPNADV